MHSIQKRASAETLEHCRAQVRAYLDATGTQCGIVVAVTTGIVISVTRREAIAKAS